MSDRIKVDQNKLLDLLKSAPNHPLGRYLGFELSDKDPLAPLADEVLVDFERTSGFAVYQREPKPGEKTIGEFGIDVDLTPFVVSLLTWILKTVLDQVLEGRRATKLAKQKTAPLTEEELQRAKELVIGFGKSINDQEILSPQVTRKFADSIERVLRRHPEILLRMENDSSQ